LKIATIARRDNPDCDDHGARCCDDCNVRANAECSAPRLLG